MDDYHKPEHVKLVEEMLADLDGDDLAAKSNTLTGGSTCGEDALKLVGMVGLAALHAPGTEVLVAGFGALANGIELRLFFHGELAAKAITNGTEGL